VHCYSVPYSNHMGFMQHLKAFFAFAFAARKKAVDLGVDTIFATSTPVPIVLSGVPASRRNMIPMVFEVRDLWSDYNFWPEGALL
jgi:hypothetical protein